MEQNYEGYIQKMVEAPFRLLFLMLLEPVELPKRLPLIGLRHGFVAHMLNNGADILQIREFLRNESILTTSMYIHLSNEQILGVS